MFCLDYISKKCADIKCGSLFSVDTCFIEPGGKKVVKCQQSDMVYKECSKILRLNNRFFLI